MDEIIQYAIERKGNFIVRSCAGSGKTYKIKQIVKALDNKTVVLVTAFNTNTVNKTKEELSPYTLTTVCTLHSLGYQIFNANHRGKAEMNDSKYITYIMSHINELSDCNPLEMKKQSKNRYIYNLRQLLNYGRQELCSTYEDMMTVAEFHHLDLMGDEPAVVLKALNWGKEHTDVIDYLDMLWLPIVLKMDVSQFKYDYIFVDEAQDCTKLNQALLRVLSSNHDTIIGLFGDPHQTINRWAGADIKVFDNFKAEYTAIEFSMPVSRRCSKEVVRHAQAFVPEIQALEDAPEGVVKKEGVLHSDPKGNDLVLCRCTAPLVVYYQYLLKIGKKCFITGKEIGEDMIREIRQLKTPHISENLDKDGILPRMYKDMFNTIDEIAERDMITIDDASVSEEAMEKYDKIKAIEALSYGIDDEDTLTRRIASIFVAHSNEGIELSTIHKAKGLERDDVYILRPDLLPSPFAKTEWEMDEENALQYVAITRAKKNLYFITENDNIVPNRFGEKDKMLRDFDKKRELIANIHFEYKAKDDSIQTVFTPNKKIGGNKFKNIFGK